MGAVKGLTPEERARARRMIAFNMGDHRATYITLAGWQYHRAWGSWPRRAINCMDSQRHAYRNIESWQKTLRLWSRSGDAYG